MATAIPDHPIELRVLCLCVLVVEVYRQQGKEPLWELRRWYHRLPHARQLPLFHRVRQSQEAWQSIHQILFPELEAPGAYLRQSAG